MADVLVEGVDRIVETVADAGSVEDTETVLVLFWFEPAVFALPPQAVNIAGTTAKSVT